MISMSAVRCPMSDVFNAALKQSRNENRSILVVESASIIHVTDHIGHWTSDRGNLMLSLVAKTIRALTSARMLTGANL